jgi:hypothetical protein
MLGSTQDLGSHQAFTILDSTLTFTMLGSTQDLGSTQGSTIKVSTQDLGSPQGSTIKVSTQDLGSPQDHTTLALPLAQVLADLHLTFQPSIQTIPTTMYLVQVMGV